MKTKWTHAVVCVIAGVLIMQIQFLMAGEKNVKKERGGVSTQLMAGATESATAKTANSNIKVECLKSNKSQIPYPVQKDDLVNAGSPSLQVKICEFRRFRQKLPS